MTERLGQLHLDVQEMNVAKCERPRLLVRPDPGES
jgi:hypothetical protein